jgi:hypothetical protein
MRVIERRIETGGRADWVAIYPLFDIHLGTSRCREDKLKRVIAEIKQNANAYWIGGGDYAEFITRSDPRHKESDLAAWLHGKDDIARHQVQRFIELITPIADRCIGVLSGNHEAQILRHCERNVYGNVLESIKDASGQRGQLGLGYGGFIVLRIERGGHHTHTLTIFTEHGYGGGRTKGSDVLNSQRIFAHVGCDVYLTGHRHKAHLIPHTRIELVEGKAREMVKISAMPGSFRERVTEHDEDDPGGYEDMACYPAGDQAGVRIWYRPSGNELRGEVYSY